MAASFQNQKAASLSQVDLSKKGSIDDQIIGLVKYINEKEIFFTTSSCSGRIAVFSEVCNVTLNSFLHKLNNLWTKTLWLSGFNATLF